MCGGFNTPSFTPPPPPPEEADYKKAINTERDKTRKRAGLNKTILTDNALNNTPVTTEKKTLLGQ